MRRLTAIVILIVVVVFCLATYFSGRLGYERAGEQLELEVVPGAVPRSGSWLVTSSLFNSTTNSRVVVDSSIVMTATLDDGTKTISTKNTTNGQASFSVPLHTVAVRFDASHQTYNASVSFSGSTVVGEGVALPVLGPAAGAGFALAIAMWFRYNKGKGIPWRVSACFPGVIGGCLPLAYLIHNYPTWSGTGWFPYSFLGIPYWAFGALGLVEGVVAGILVKLPLKSEPKAEKAKMKPPGPWD